MSGHFSRKNAHKAFRAQLFLRPAGMVLNIASFVLLVRVLPEQAYGIYALLFSCQALVATLFSLGLANTVQRYVPEYSKTGEFTRAKRLVTVALLLRALSILLVAAVAACFMDWIVATYGLQGYEALLVPVILFLLLQFTGRIVTLALNGLLFQKAALWSQIAFSLVKVAAYIVIYLEGWGLSAVLWTEVAANVVLLVFVAVNYVRRVMPLEGGPATFGSTERRRILRYAFFYNFNDVGVFGLGRDVDNFVLGALANPTAVGAYAFAAKVTDIINRIAPVNFFYSVIQPLIFSLDRERDRERVTRIFSVLVKVNYMIVLPLWAILAVSLEPLIRVVFGGKFIDYAWLVIAVAGVQSILLAKPLGLVAQFEEKAQVILYSKITSAMNIVLDLALIPVMGIWGVVLATSFSLLMRDAIVWVAIRKEARVAGGIAFFAGTIVMWGGFVVLTRMVMLNLPVHDVIRIAMGTAAGLGVAFVYARWILSNPAEREMVIETGILPRRLRAILLPREKEI